MEAPASRPPLAEKSGGVLNVDELKAEVASFMAEVEGWASAKAAAAESLRRKNDAVIRDADGARGLRWG